MSVLQVGEWQEAVTIVQELQGKGVQPNTAAYNALIKALGVGLQFHAVSTPQPYASYSHICLACSRSS